jgi:hypothetical protein
VSLPACGPFRGPVTVSTNRNETLEGASTTDAACPHLELDAWQQPGEGLVRGWRGVRVDLPDEGDEPALAFYYPDCAQREFG